MIVARTTTLLEPRPSASATRAFAGLVRATLGTRCTSGCNKSRGWCRAMYYGHWCVSHVANSLHDLTWGYSGPTKLQRTFASFHAFSPGMIVASIATLLEPRPSASAARTFAVLVRATLGTLVRARSNDRSRNSLCCDRFTYFR